MTSPQFGGCPAGRVRTSAPRVRPPVLTLLPGGRSGRGPRHGVAGPALVAPPAPLRPIRPAPLRLTRRGRRLVAGLSIATGLGVAALTVAVVDGDAGGLRLAGDTSVVVRSGDTLWSIASDTAPEEDIRAVVDAIMVANGLQGAGLVPGQVLQLP